ncbi:DivIVA domain-containing protein [Phytomonospora sp. NPDC050363]|uniref:DivIVA domain-containing protein n=1 Tax=Phytomonospora sp. NPDC050363 TaxID=3155642 RepID=UPI0033F55839
MSNFFDSDLQTTEFSVAMRGYDRAQVDTYAHQVLAAMKTAKQHRVEAERRLDDVRTKLRRTEERIANLERRLADSAAAIAENERPTLAGLGARVEKLLRAAELEADDQREDARRQAVDIHSRALAEAAVATESARAEAQSVMSSAIRDAADARASAAAEAEELRTTARHDHDLKVTDAARECEQIRSIAQNETSELKSTAEREISMHRAVTDREVTQLRAGVARDVDELQGAANTLLAEAADERQSEMHELSLALAEKRERAECEDSARHAQSVTLATNLLEEAEKRSILAEQRASETEQRAQERGLDADRRAADLAARADATAHQLRTEAEAEAARIRAEAETEARGMVAPLREELDNLTGRRDSVTAHLGELQRQLGTGASPLRDLVGDGGQLPINRPREPYESDRPTQQIPVVRKGDLARVSRDRRPRPYRG